LAKRYSDSRKWQKAWFRKLSQPEKLFWIFVLDHCDHAGIWEVDFEFVQIFIPNIKEQEIRDKFNKQYIEFDNGKRWFLKDFIEFQYGELKETNRVHRSVSQILDKFNLLTGRRRPLDKPKDKDKVKDKRKGKEDQLKELSLQLNELQSLHSNVDVKKEFDKFKDYLLSKGRTYRDYKAAFRNWLRNSSKMSINNNSYKPAANEIYREPEFEAKCPECDFKRMIGVKTYAVCPTHQERLV
tara:strand:- start:29 stop:748 length:720 start_codon:yes stop_codon:yes gene_type:complete